jgi:hypothetical protein
MPQPSLSLQFTCPLCGGHALSLPEGYTDRSIATCGSCGADIATWGELKAIASRRMAEDSGTPAPFKGLSSVKGSTRSR